MDSAVSWLVVFFVGIFGSILIYALEVSENQRAEKVAIFQEYMTEEINEKLNLNEDDINYVTIIENQLYKAVLQDKNYEIYLNEEREVDSIVEVGKVIN